jgi:hypothetical protein
VRAHLVDRLGETDAALGIGGQLPELALAAPAGVDLRLHDIKRPRQLLGGRDRFLDRHRGNARGNRDTELPQKLLGLIFVDVHPTVLVVVWAPSAPRSDP